MKIRNFSFGATAAVVSNVSLIVGLDAATAARATILSSLLIVAIADNMTDSLSVHIYQESERLEEHGAFLATLSNFATRLTLSLSFVFLILLLPLQIAVIAAVLWGAVLLCGLTYAVARARKANPLSEIAKHLIIAVLVIFTSKLIGYYLGS